MEPTITCGQQYAHQSDIHHSRFDDVNLANSKFNNVNLSGAQFPDANTSNTSLENISFQNAKLLNADYTGMTIEGILVDDLLSSYRSTE